MQIRVIILAFIILTISCGKNSADVTQNTKTPSAPSKPTFVLDSKFLKPLGFPTPYSSVGNLATPVLEVEVPETLGVLQLFSDSSCSNANIVGQKYVDGSVSSTRVRLGNLYDGVTNIYAKFTDKNGDEIACKEMDQYDLSNKNYDIQTIFSNNNAFAAIRSDGSVITWGVPSYGGNSSSVSEQLDGSIAVTSIAATERAFAAVRSDGSVITWGDSTYGGDSSGVSPDLNGNISVTNIIASERAFAALRVDGSVITWGDNLYGGDSSDVSTELNGTTAVTSITSSFRSFAAIRSDGSVVSWGSTYNGGDSSSVSSELNGSIAVTSIASTNTAFAALI